MSDPTSLFRRLVGAYLLGMDPKDATDIEELEELAVPAVLIASALYGELYRAGAESRGLDPAEVWANTNLEYEGKLAQEEQEKKEEGL